MTNKIKILAVDDEPSITKMVGKVLGREGYEVIECHDSKRVEEYLLYTDLGLVITDYKMPGLDGLQVLELIKESNPSLPVLFLTGQGTIETAVQATKAGAVVFLTKPFDPDDLVQAVRTHARVDQAIPDDIRETIDNADLSGVDNVVSPDRIILKDEIVSTDTIPEGLVEVKFDDILAGQVLPFALVPADLQQADPETLSPENLRNQHGLHHRPQKPARKKGTGVRLYQGTGIRAFLEYHRAVKASPTLKLKAVRDKKKLLLYGKAVEAISEILADPTENKNIKSAVDLVDDMLQSIVNDPVTYMDMFKLFKRDTSIFNHSANVCLLCVSFGVFLGLEQKQVSELGLGGLFHDVGMNRLDKRILEKAGPLNKLEWAEVRKHPERGLALMKSSKLVPVRSLRVVLEHHEVSDGSGYPRGLTATNISKISHLCRIVDKYDAMTTPKPYREAFTPPEALKRIYLEEPSPGMQKVILRFIAFLGGK